MSDQVITDNTQTLINAEKEIQQLKARVARLEKELNNLVNLKDYKDSYGKDGTYIKNQPEAWSRAREALNQSPKQSLDIKERISLTGRELKDALDFVWPDPHEKEQGESEITIEWMPKRTIGDEDLEAGLYAYFTECPEEGVYGPLDSDSNSKDGQ